MILAGCLASRDATLDMIPRDYPQRHPIVLGEAPHTVELFIGNRRGSLNDAQRTDVLAFAQIWRREAGGGIIIDLPARAPNERSATVAAQEVRAILTNAGVPADAIATRRSAVSDPRKLATLRLHYPKVTAEAGPCGLWPYDLGATNLRERAENRQYYNFGCAHQRNLAAMVDNPADLVQPRGEMPSYTSRRTTVFNKHQRGEGTATVYPDASKGSISNVGQ